jgi:hypothetical protein
MKSKADVAKDVNQISRRGLFRSATAAAVVLSAGSFERVTSQIPSRLTNYGPSTAGKTELVPETIFPLFAAWLLFTTNGPFNIDADLLSCAAGLHPDSAKRVLEVFDTNASAFKPVRTLFEGLAKEFSAGKVPYSGGQCPAVADTVAPVASLLGTPTPKACPPSKQSAKPSAKPK